MEFSFMCVNDFELLQLACFRFWKYHAGLGETIAQTI